MTIYVNARAFIERQGESGPELLLQLRARPGEPERWELPGGQINLFEPVFTALGREIAEETGLTLTLIHGEKSHVLHQGEHASVETFEPFFAYQTTEGPVDSLGFYFRCQAAGTVNQTGDGSKQPTWVPISLIRERCKTDQEQFDWLTQAALERFLDQIDRKEG